MPWAIFDKGDRGYCIYKLGADGKPAGKTLGCHDSRDEAEAQLAALYASEERKSMNIWQRLAAGLRNLARELEEPVIAERAIEEVDSWDGSASNYASTEDYCRACLINVNPAAGRDDPAEWTQSHCMLPVKAPGSTAYADKAIHAAAGGHGIGRVKRPDDVPEDDWKAALKRAASKLISLYKEMGETAPDSVYEAAGKEPPEKRVLSLSSIQEQAQLAIQQMEFPGEFPWVNDIYEDAGRLVAIVSAGGKLYRVPLGIDGTQVLAGAPQEVEVQFAPRARPAISVTRQADGSHRWFAIACTAVLNRVGEIDSRALFDSFVEAAKSEGYPTLRFYHVDGLDFGRADWLAREGDLFLASGTFDEDHPLTRAFIDAIENGRGTWGTSHGFVPTQPPQLVEVAAGVTIPVYTAGICREISVLPEDRAAAWYTAITAEVKRTMRTEVREALKTLFGGDEAEVERIEKLVDERQREITDGGLITRDGEGQDAEADAAGQPPVAEPEAEAEATSVQPEVVLTDEALEAIAARVKAEFDARFAELEARIGTMPAVPDLAPLNEALGGLRARLDALERSDEEKRREWQADRPARQTVTVTYRPREQAAAQGDKPLSRHDIAQATLQQLPAR